ncbi:unnamed protein product [Paramecium sonneborni]|uniref:Cyclic nucleotide-binding domain-containing protein n=1 Tax=Paramecium sonneborni TaxID=65129 RepID=A0A8S1R4G5_9CILI|nr:unnamed protein product [Paramecium sonneborni]
MNNSIKYDEQQNSKRFDTQFNKQTQALFRRQVSQQEFNNTWKVYGFNIILIVLKFIKAITKQKFTNSLKQLNHKFFKLLKDNTADYHYYQYRGYLKKVNLECYMSSLNNKFNFLQYFRRNCVKRILQAFLLEPDDTIIIIWNIYFLWIVTINVLFVSLRLSFEEIVEMDWNLKDFIFEQLPTYSFLLEIIIKFNTCIYSRGVLIKNRKRLIKRYIRREFLIDMVLIIPFFIGRQLDFIYLDLIIILKMFQISKLTYSLFNRLELTQQQTAIFELVKLIFFILLCAHFSACIWHKLGIWGNWGNVTSITWLKNQQLQDSLWIDRYIVSFYWSIVTMTTIGYGDITPVNLTERLFCIVMTLISTATFAYSVNSIGQIFKDMSKQSVQFKTNMNSLNKFLKNQKISPALQIQFRRYFEYFWSKPSQEVIQFQDQIPKQLKDLMIVEINMKMLKQLDLFKQFSNSLLNTLCLEFQEQQLQPDEYLFKLNYRADKLYILVNGQIDLFVWINKKKRIFEKIKNPGLIGQLNFFLNTQYNYEAIATKNSKILIIDRQSLIKNIKQSEIDYEIYKNFEDDIKIKQQLDKIQVQCSVCCKSNHLVLQCPLFIGCINRTKVLYHLRHNILQYRSFQFRNNQDRRISTKKHHYHVMESLLIYIMKNDELCNLEGIKKQFQAVLKQQQQYEEKMTQTQSNQLSNQISLSQNMPASIICKSNQSLHNNQQIQNQNLQKNNPQLSRLEVLSEKQNQFGILSQSQDIRLITALNNQKIQPILEEPQTKEERTDKLSVNLSQQLAQVQKQENSILPDTKEPQSIQFKIHSIRQKFEKQHTDLDVQKNRQKQFKRLVTEKEDNSERFSKQFGFNNKSHINSQWKKDQQGQNNTIRKQSAYDQINQMEKLQENVFNKQFKLEETPSALENSMSYSIKNNILKPNIEIYQVNEYNNEQNFNQEKDLTNLYLEDQLLKNKQRFFDKQISFQEPIQNQIGHFPLQDFKALEQSMITQYDKIKLKEELLQQQFDRQQTIVTKNKESKESKETKEGREVINPKTFRGLPIKVNSDDSSDEDINGQKLIRGQYIEIFRHFEKVKEFQAFYPKNNISQIILQLQQFDFNLQQNFMRRRKVKKQDAIINLLKKAQHLIRKSQQ